jgi:hypothetical protein
MLSIKLLHREVLAGGPSKPVIKETGAKKSKPATDATDTAEETPPVTKSGKTDSEAPTKE